jgi:hypothetical protein
MMRLLGLAMSVALMASGPDDGPQLASALTNARPASATPMMMRAASAGMVGETDHSVASMEKEAQTDPVFCVDSFFSSNGNTSSVAAPIIFHNDTTGAGLPEVFFLEGQRVLACANGPMGEPPMKQLRLKDAYAAVDWTVVSTTVVNHPDPSKAGVKVLLVIAKHSLAQSKTSPSTDGGKPPSTQAPSRPRRTGNRLDDVGGVLTISIDGDDCIAFPVVCAYSG